MKVLHVINSLTFGGAERLIHDVALHLQTSHPEVTLDVCTLFGEHFWGDRLKEKGVVVHNIGIAKWNAAMAVIRLSKLISRQKYDIVHAHLWPTLYYVSVVSRMVNHPVYIYTEHNTDNKRRRHRSLRWLEAIAYTNYEAIVANSAETKEALAAWVQECELNIQVVENGLPVPGVKKESYRLSDPPRLLTIGRLAHYKGIDVAIEAVKRLLEQGAPVSMTVLGEGSDEQKLRRQAYGLPVKFMGFQTRPQRWMATHDCLIVPSRWEGFGLTAVEGQMVGIPVVASRVDYLTTLVREGVTGLLFTPEDPEDLARKIEKFLTDDELRCRVSESARSEALRRWPLDRHIADLLSVYARLLSPVAGG